MPLRTGEELFVAMLSEMLHSEKNLLSLAEDLYKYAEDQYIKDTLEVRAHLTKQEISNIEECFKLLGKQPLTTAPRFMEVRTEDFVKELDAIEGPLVKALYLVSTIHRVQGFHIAEYRLLIAMSRFVGYQPVTTLLERNLADKMEFIERTNEILREVGKTIFEVKAKEWYEERAA